jgi:hypothetical protein
VEWRFRLQEKHSELLANLFLNFHTDYDKAQKMRRSDVQSIFGSKTFTDWLKGRENKVKGQTALLERIDNVIKSIGNLGKALTRR